MAKFLVVPGGDAAIRPELIEKVSINQTGTVSLTLVSNKTVIAPGRYNSIKEVLKILKVVDEHSDYEIDWRAAVDIVNATEGVKIGLPIKLMSLRDMEIMD